MGPHGEDPRIDQGLLALSAGGTRPATLAHPRPDQHSLPCRFAYVDGVLADGEVLKLCCLRYAGYANQWGFAIYRASHDDYEESFLPTGSTGGTAEDALDTACGLYLNDPTAWTD